MFDIGWYDFRLAGSCDCFFNLEPTIATFCEDGKQPCSNDLLFLSVNTGAKDITHLLHEPCRCWIDDVLFVWCSPKNFEYLIHHNLLKAFERRHFSVMDLRLWSIQSCFSYAFQLAAEENSKRHG